MVFRRNRRGLDLIDQPASAVRYHHYASLMRIAFDRFVLEVDPDRREKKEKKDEGYHHVVLDGAPFVRPENITANCLPDIRHPRRGCAAVDRSRLGSLQV